MCPNIRCDVFAHPPPSLPVPRPAAWRPASSAARSLLRATRSAFPHPTPPPAGSALPRRRCWIRLPPPPQRPDSGSSTAAPLDPPPSALRRVGQVGVVAARMGDGGSRRVLRGRRRAAADHVAACEPTAGAGAEEQEIAAGGDWVGRTGRRGPFSWSAVRGSRPGRFRPFPSLLLGWFP